MKPWNDIKYQTISKASIARATLMVEFANGDEIEIALNNLLPSVSESELNNIKVDDLDVLPYEVTIKTTSVQKSIPWDKLRVLSDKEFGKHLAEEADTQAKLIGIKIKRLREKKGIKSMDLAERAGLTAQTISRIEKGHQDVSFSTLRRLLASMGYDLSDLAEEEIELNEETASLKSFPHLLKRLSKIGIDPAFITNKIIPKTIVSELGVVTNDQPELLLNEAASYISNIYGWSINDIWNNSALSLDESKVNANILFKKSVRSNYHQIRAYVPYAHYLARTVLKAVKKKPSKSFPDSAEEFREILIREYGGLNLEATLKYAWDLGITVIPLDDSGYFHGAAWNINSQYVVVLKQRVKSHAKWLFDLLHELYHVFVHLQGSEDVIIETTEINPLSNEDGKEAEANSFASQVIFNGNPEPYAQEAVRLAKGKVEFLREAVQEVAKQHKIQVDSLANYVAHRLSFQGTQWWGTAEGLQVNEPDPFKIAKNELIENIEMKRLSTIDVNLLSTALKI